MDNKNREQKRKNSPVGLLVVFLVLVISGLRNIGESGGLIAAVVAVAVAGIIAAAVISAAKKSGAAKKAAENPFDHTHDRLKRESGDVCGVDEHWKSQLDGFLKSGIIDRAEYNELLKKHTAQAAQSIR